LSVTDEGYEGTALSVLPISSTERLEETKSSLCLALPDKGDSKRRKGLNQITRPTAVTTTATYVPSRNLKKARQGNWVDGAAWLGGRVLLWPGSTQPRYKRRPRIKKAGAWCSSRESAGLYSTPPLPLNVLNDAKRGTSR
jgi:hypothetical protein